MAPSVKCLLKATKHLPPNLAIAYMALVDAALPLGVILNSTPLLLQYHVLPWAKLIPELIDKEMVESFPSPNVPNDLLVPVTLKRHVENRVRAHLTPNFTQLASWKKIDPNFVWDLSAGMEPFDNNSKFDITTQAATMRNWAERLRLRPMDKLSDRRQFVLHVEQEVPFLIFAYPGYYVANLPSRRVTVVYEEAAFAYKTMAILSALALEELPCVQRALKTAPGKALHPLLEALHDAHYPYNEADPSEKTPPCPKRRLRSSESGEKGLEGDGAKADIPYDIHAKTPLREGLSRHFGLPI